MKRDYAPLEAEIRRSLGSVLNGAPIEWIDVKPVTGERREDVDAIDVFIRIGRSETPIPTTIMSSVMQVVFDAVTRLEEDVFPYVFCRFAPDQSVAA